MDELIPQDHEEELLFASQDLVGLMEYRKRKKIDADYHAEALRVMQKYDAQQKAEAEAIRKRSFEDLRRAQSGEVQPHD